MAEIEIEKKYFVYILQLNGGKYYVGKTLNAASRIAEHIKNLGSSWTKKYKPQKIIKLYKNCDTFDEDKYTIMYMAIYGIDNVRGGSFCSINLSHSEKTVLEKMIDSASDKCFKCGEIDHFAKDCVDHTDSVSKLDTLINWCEDNTEDGNILVLLDEESNKKYEFDCDGREITEIPSTNERFAKRISRKHNTSLFKLSVSSFDFHIKLLESEGYEALYNFDGKAIMCLDPDSVSGSAKKMLKEIRN